MVKISALPPQPVPALTDKVPVVSGAVTNYELLSVLITVIFANIVAGSVTQASLSTSSGEIGGAYQSWTPTLSGLFDDTKWTKTCKFVQVGKTVYFHLKLVASTTTPMSGSGDAVFTLPVQALNYSPNVDSAFTIGTGGSCDDSANISIFTTADFLSATTAKLKIHGSAGTYVGVDPMTSGAPFAWTTGDEIDISGSFEAA